MLAVLSTMSMYVWLIGWKSGLLFPRRHIVALMILRLKLAVLLGAITERNEGGGSEVDGPGGVLDKVRGEGWRERLDRRSPDVVIDGPSTTRVVYVERPMLLRLNVPSSSGKNAVPSQSSFNHTLPGLT